MVLRVTILIQIFVKGEFRENRHRDSPALLSDVNEFVPLLSVFGDRGGTVVKVLCYKSEGRWFDCRWCHWNFSLT